MISMLRISSRPSSLLRPAVIVALAWSVLSTLGWLLGTHYGLFDRPLFEGKSVADQIISPQLGFVEALLVIALVVWLTRSYQPIRPDDVGISREHAAHALVMAGIYGFLAIIGGVVLGQAMGTPPFSFHLPGTLIGAHTHDLVTPMQAVTWALYNLVAYVVIPLAYVHGRFPGSRSWLRSANRRRDLVLILIVLAVESVAQLAALSSAIFDLSPMELLAGAPLAFVLYLLGTGLPTMIFVQAIIVPRLLVLTGSMVWSVVLGGLAYAAMHIPESWMLLTSPSMATLSIIFLLFTYFAPGMVKATMTLRTGNAWTHMWAYHAIAPHVLIDTPLIVAIFLK